MRINLVSYHSSSGGLVTDTEGRLTVTNHARLSALHTVFFEFTMLTFKALVASGPYTISTVPPNALLRALGFVSYW